MGYYSNNKQGSLIWLTYGGTGWGSGLDIEFEKRDKDKFLKYHIDPEEYDHTDASQGPSRLFDTYTKSKEPFLTVIRLWDNVSDKLSCYEYNLFYIERNEAGNAIEVSTPAYLLSTPSRK